MTAAQTATRGAAINPNPAPPDYFTRVIPEPYRILGLALRPLSLGRYRLLKRFDVAFVAAGAAQAGLNDLLLGVLICSMRVEECREFFAAPDWAREVARWSKRIVPKPWIGCVPVVGKWWRARHGFNFIEKIQLFQRYIEDAQRVPNYSRAENSPSRNTGHWSHAIEVCLRAELNWSEAEINEAPLSKALADYFRYAESQGLVVLWTDADFAQAEHNSARIELALAEWRSNQVEGRRSKVEGQPREGA